MTVDGRGIVTIQHNAPDLGQGMHNLLSVIASRTSDLAEPDRSRTPDTAVDLPFVGVAFPTDDHADGSGGDERV